MGQPQFPNFATAAWEVARSSGVMSHLPQEEALYYRAIYTELDWVKARVDEQRMDWATLSALDLGAPISPMLQAELLPTLAHANTVADKFARNERLVAGADSANASYIGLRAAKVGVDSRRSANLNLSAATLASRAAFCEAS